MRCRARYGGRPPAAVGSAATDAATEGGAMFRSIVVGTDGSPTAGEAVRRAHRLAGAFRADLHVVNAYRPPAVLLATAEPGLGPAALPVWDAAARDGACHLLDD